MATCDRCGIETGKPRGEMMPMLFESGERRMCEFCYHYTAAEQEESYGIKHLKLIIPPKFLKEE